MWYHLSGLYIYIFHYVGVSDIQPDTRILVCLNVQAEFVFDWQCCLLAGMQGDLLPKIGTNAHSSANHFRAIMLRHSAKYDLSMQ